MPAESGWSKETIQRHFIELLKEVPESSPQGHWASEGTTGFSHASWRFWNHQLRSQAGMFQPSLQVQDPLEAGLSWSPGEP